MMSYVFYIAIFALTVFLADRAERTQRKRYMILAMLCLSVVAALRGISVGIDSASYAQKFAEIAAGRPERAYGLESTFKWICGVLLGIWNHPNFLFAVFAVATHGCVFARLWDFRDRISLGWATMVYCVVFYFISLNIVRQFLAVAIIFYGTRFIQDRKYIIFGVLVLVAAMFHRSALIGALYMGILLLDWDLMKQKQQELLITAAVVVLGIGLTVFVLSADKYLKYFATIQLNFGLMIPAKLFLLGSVVALEYLDRKRGLLQTDPVEQRLGTEVQIYYLVGLLITALGYLFEYMDRIGLYFYLYEAVYVGLLVKKFRYRRIYMVVMALIYAYTLWTGMRGNGQGQMPYIFFWQG